ncbi:MAG: hypothetical protein K2O95_06860 [Clostridia bacterium]|nr:hypothetical protein [Clostridia bacterium]MDE6758773.1 hypothetical protein [Clostridia bacterium]MDE7079815.1 hypothetical protein [Clostridia bacterium]
MNESKIMAKRLKRVLLQDKIVAYEGLTKALEGDIKMLLSYYMTLSGELSVNIDVLDEGNYQINISAKANNINAPQIV